MQGREHEHGVVERVVREHHHRAIGQAQVEQGLADRADALAQPAPRQRRPAARAVGLGQRRGLGGGGRPVLDPLAHAARVGLQRLGVLQQEGAAGQLDALGAARRQQRGVFEEGRGHAVSSVMHFHTLVYGLAADRRAVRPAKHQGTPRCRSVQCCMLCGPGDGIIPAMSSAPVRPLPAPRAARRKPAAPRAAKAVLTPEDWVRAATQVLVDHGIDHVRVDVLAGELAVTRGSFYWHFRDREDLLRRVLQAWREETTVQLTRRADAARIAYHEALFQALGFGAAEAGHRAFLMYGYEVAESLMAGQGGEAQREQRRRFVLQLLQQPLPA